MVQKRQRRITKVNDLSSKEEMDSEAQMKESASVGAVFVTQSQEREKEAWSRCRCMGRYSSRSLWNSLLLLFSVK